MSIASWYEFSLQQMAAESYLFGIDISNAQRVIDALVRGNTPNSPPTGNTRFTDIQAQDFLDRFEIVGQYPNDNSGFSATLTRDRSTGEFTLSFRSTEYKN